MLSEDAFPCPLMVKGQLDHVRCAAFSRQAETGEFVFKQGLAAQSLKVFVQFLRHLVIAIYDRFILCVREKSLRNYAMTFPAFQLLKME